MIGIDIVKIERIKKFIDRFGNRGLQRFLSDHEIALCQNNIKRTAGYWAVKEAISKALGVGIGSEFSFHDVEISRTIKGSPVATLNINIIQKFSVKNIAISITHDGEYAVAVATIEF